MRKNLLLFFVLLLGSIGMFHAQQTVFLETFGEPPVSYRPSVNDFTGYDNKAPIKFSTTTLSKPEIAGDFAFGNNHVSFKDGVEVNFIISNIPAAGYSNLRLSFDIATEALEDTSDPEFILFTNVNRLTLTCNGVEVELPNIPFEKRRIPLHVENILLPVADVMELKFYYSKQNNLKYGGGYRIDNIKIEGAEIIEDNEFLEIPSTQVSASHKISPSGQYVVGGEGTVIGFFWDIKNSDYTTFSDGSFHKQTEANDVNTEGFVAGSFKNTDYIINATNDETGQKEDGPIRIAGVWKDGVWTSLGIGTLQLENLTSFEHGSQAFSISEDGKTVGGCLNDGTYDVIPCTWTKNDDGTWTYNEYSFPTPSTQGAKIEALSGDGKIASGWVTSENGGRMPIIWTSPTDYTIIGQDEYEFPDGVASNISENGKYVSLSINGKAAIYFVEDETYKYVEGHSEANTTTITAVTNNGMAIGYSDFGNPIIGNWRLGFVYSDKLGFMDFGDFINTYASDVTIPEHFDFSSDARVLTVPMDISKDGKVITGWQGYSAFVRSTWVLKLGQTIKIFEKPQNLQAVVSDRNKVKLTWEAPEASDMELTGYKLFKDADLVADLEKEELSYEYEVAEAGYFEYTVSAVYTDGNSPRSNRVAVTIVDNYNIPFFENFDDNSLTNNYWTLEQNNIGWSIQFQARGIYMYAATFETPIPEGAYSGSLVSKPLDAKSLENVYLTYAIRYQIGMPETAKDVLNVEVYDGTNWVSIKKYESNVQNYGYNIEAIDISNIAAGKLFQVRFRVSGEDNLSINYWDIDNFRIDSKQSAGNAPTGLEGNYNEDETTANMIWKNTSGVYELTYEREKRNPYSFVQIGMMGEPFIAANQFDVADLELYKGNYLTSVSAYINQNMMEEEMEMNVVAFVGDNKITQTITSFIPNAWNTFALDNPILIDGSESIKIGVEVTQYNTNEAPMICDDLGNPADGKGNIYYLGDSKTWGKLSDDDEWYGNWFIIGNLTEEGSNIIPERDEALMGYNIYHNSERLNNGLIYSPNFIHNDATPLSCYEVKAYYNNGAESAASNQYCVKGGSISKEVLEGLKVYPNPARDYININTEFEKASLYNINGQLMIEATESQIPLTNVPEGVYFLKVVSTTGTWTQKIIVKK